MSKPLIVLSDHHENWVNLNPLTLCKPIAHLRVGITTILEKWEFVSESKVQVKTCMPYLKHFNTWEMQTNTPTYIINSSIIPNSDLYQAILNLDLGQSLYKGKTMIASKIILGKASFESELQYPNEIIEIAYPWDIFSKNKEILIADFKSITKNKTSGILSDTNLVIGSKEDIFLEEGAQVEGAILNSQSGPIYLGKDSEVMEGSVVRGPLALCEGGVLKLSTKIYGATTVGPYSKVGGEINNSVIQGFSNKGHDGFLGNSVIGEWCNLGADTNNSNLKNNYGEVKVYNYQKKDYIPSGLQFLGLIMGDHSKCGINTMFNTGTVVGVFANIYGGGFPPKYIPSFAWGGSEGFSSYRLDKALEVAERVMSRRNKSLSEEDVFVLKYLHDKTSVV